MGRVLAVTTVIDQVCDGKLPAEAARSALEQAGRLPPASTPRFTLFAALGAASLGVIFGALDATSLLLIAASAAIGALVRRWLSGFSNNPLIQPLCAAFIAGVVAAAASRFQLSDAITLVAFCPCMVLVPGPHILNGAIDLARTRIALGIARLAYAGVFVLMICAGLLVRVRGTGANLPVAGSSARAAGRRRDCGRMRRRLVRHLLLDAMASAGIPDRGWHARACGALGGDLLASGNAVTGALVACILVSVIVTPVVNRLHLPFAALGFSAVVSLMPGFFLFHAATGLVELVSIGPRAPADLLTSIVMNGTTAFLVIMAMTFGLILPRMLFERLLPAPA